MNGLQSWDDDIRYQALYTVEDVIINEDDNKWLKKINKKLIDNIEKDKRYNRIYRERLINRIRERMGKKKTKLWRFFHYDVCHKCIDQGVREQRL